MLAGFAHAAGFTVSNSANSGGGTLRQAIINLNNAGSGTHTITFQQGLSPVQLSSNLTSITGTEQIVSINLNGATVNGAGHRGRSSSSIRAR